MNNTVKLHKMKLQFKVTSVFSYHSRSYFDYSQ
jgi:hypothetical protein